MRQGWASDFSYSEHAWEVLLEVAKMLKKHDIHLLVITKLFYLTKQREILEELAELGVEIRVSLAASDTRIHLSKKLAFLEKYRSLGGVSVPYLMTAKYSIPELSANQQAIVDWVVQGDYIA
ncbi:MAG: hypothetical protein ACOYN2_06035 [Patescibacteria group bacterium]